MDCYRKEKLPKKLQISKPGRNGNSALQIRLTLSKLNVWKRGLIEGKLGGNAGMLLATAQQRANLEGHENVRAELCLMVSHLLGQEGQVRNPAPLHAVTRESCRWPVEG